MKRFARFSAAILVSFILAGCPSPIDMAGSGGSLAITVADGVSRSMVQPAFYDSPESQSQAFVQSFA